MREYTTEERAEKRFERRAPSPVPEIPQSGGMESGAGGVTGRTSKDGDDDLWLHPEPVQAEGEGCQNVSEMEAHLAWTP
jgi:hypothetical protein